MALKRYKLETDHSYNWPIRHYIYEHNEYGITLKIIITGDVELAQRIEFFLNNEDALDYEKVVWTGDEELKPIE